MFTGLFGSLNSVIETSVLLLAAGLLMWREH